MRVIAGSLGGRRLSAPPGTTTRPTSDRVREALFSILGPPPPRARVLDLYAGAGGLGIEAMSRGAATACFVEQARPAIRCIEQNLAALGLGAACRVMAVEAGRALVELGRAAALDPAAGFDWIFVDPPYATDEAERALAALGAGALCRPGAVVVVEHDRRRALDPAHGCLVSTDLRRYGDTAVSFFRRSAP